MAKSRATRVAEQKRIKEKHGAGSPQHLAAMDRTRAASGKPPKEKKEETKTPPHLVLRKAAEDEIARNEANMRRATVREGLLAEAGVPFPHLTVHDRVASGKGIWETDEERQARATQTARATSMAIAEAGGIKEWNKKIDEIVRETEKKEDPDEDIPIDDGTKKKKKVITKDKPIVIKERGDTSRDRVRLTPQMTGGSEYLATDYNRPAFQDWSDLEPPNMPGLLGSAKAQQDLLGSGLKAYQTWAQPAIPYQPPVGPTYATRASLLGSSPAEAAAAVANNQRNNQQLNNQQQSGTFMGQNYANQGENMMLLDTHNKAMQLIRGGHNQGMGIGELMGKSGWVNDQYSQLGGTDAIVGGGSFGNYTAPPGETAPLSLGYMNRPGEDIGVTTPQGPFYGVPQNTAPATNIFSPVNYDFDQGPFTGSLPSAISPTAAATAAAMGILGPR